MATWTRVGSECNCFSTSYMTFGHENGPNWPSNKKLWEGLNPTPLRVTFSTPLLPKASFQCTVVVCVTITTASSYSRAPAWLTSEASSSVSSPDECSLAAIQPTCFSLAAAAMAHSPPLEERFSYGNLHFCWLVPSSASPSTPLACAFATSSGEQCIALTFDRLASTALPLLSPNRFFLLQ